MDTTIIASFVGVAGILLGVFVGNNISKKTTIDIIKRQNFDQASARLRDAFKHELLALNPALSAIEGDLPAFLDKSFQKHRLAVLDFSYFLDPGTKDIFYKTWKKYYSHKSHTQENSVHYLEQYSCLHQGFTIQKQHNIKVLARKRIESILDFAKPI